MMTSRLFGCLVLIKLLLPIEPSVKLLALGLPAQAAVLAFESMLLTFRESFKRPSLMLCTWHLAAVSSSPVDLGLLEVTAKALHAC